MTASISGFRPYPATNIATQAQEADSSATYKGAGFTRPVVNPAARLASAPARQYDARNVKKVFAQVQDSFKNGVSTSELKQAAKNISSLSPSERSSLVNFLARTPQGGGTLLDKFLGEVVSPGFGDQTGLGTADQRSLFRDLIPTQNGQNIERIFKAIGSATGAEFREAQSTFTALVAKEGTAAQKADAVARLVDDAGRGKSKPAACFIGELLGSLKNPVEIKATLSKLDRPTWDAVVKSAVRVVTNYNMNDPTAQPTLTRDTSVFSDLASAVAKSGGINFKANFIAAAGLLVKENADATPAELGTITKGMTKVIKSDSNGVLAGTLALSGYSQKIDKSGSPIGQYASDGADALRVYNKSLIRAGQGQTIRILMAQLRSGNNFQQDALARINADSKAARTLGLYTGTVISALEAQTSDKTRAVVMSAIFGGTVIDVAKEAMSFYQPAALPAKFLAPGAKALVALTALQVNSDAVADSRNASKFIVKVAKPQGPGGEALSPQALTTFDAAVEAGRAASR